MGAIKIIYKTEDGAEFESLCAANAQEAMLAKKRVDNFHKFLENTFSGERLLEEHKLTDSGVWAVYGEDPNGGLSGYHHKPFLGKFEGTLEKVVRHAVNMKHFWQGGGGGEIKRTDLEVITKL